MNKIDKPSLIDFPCQFPIKIMGINDPELVPQIIAIVSGKSPEFNPDSDIIVKNSSKGNYLSVTASIMAHSQEQIDSIYVELNSHKLVKITL